MDRGTKSEFRLREINFPHALIADKLEPTFLYVIRNRTTAGCDSATIFLDGRKLSFSKEEHGNKWKEFAKEAIRLLTEALEEECKP